MSQLFIPSFNPALTVLGQQAPAAKMAFYRTGTTTLVDVYDESGDPISQAPNSYGTVGVAADITGRFPQIYLGDELDYKVVLRTAQGAQIGNVIDPYVNIEQLVENLIAGLVDPDGSGKIGASHDETYPQATLGQRFKQTVYVTDAPYNAANNGSDVTVVCQNAADDIGSNGGGVLVFPAGSFGISVLNIPSNVTVWLYAGATTIVSLNTTYSVSDANPNGVFNTNGAENVYINGLTIDTNNNRPTVKIILSSNVHINNLAMDGSLTSGNIAGNAVHVAGSDRVFINQPSIQNFNNGVYVSKSALASGTISGRVVLNGGEIRQTNHGTARPTPTGFYAYFCDTAEVNGTVFRNIKPSTAGGSNAGYGFYEGDGAVDTVILNNVECYDDDGVVTASTFGALTTTAQKVIINGLETSGPFYIGAKLRAIHGVVNGFTNDGGSTTGLLVGGATGTSPKEWVVNNPVILDCTETGIIAGDSNLVAPETVTINNPVVKRAGRAGIWSLSSSYTLVSNPTIIDCNTTGQATLDANTGITFFGGRDGSVVGGLIENTAGGPGLMAYGVACSSGTNRLVVDPSVRIINMVTAPTTNLLAAPPTTGTWSAGQEIYLWGATVGKASRLRCLTGGTPGTWQYYDQIGVETSIGSTPQFAGQQAVVAGAGYVAVGTASSADWLKTTP